MREFSSGDGRNWSARVYDGPSDGALGTARVGWEVILFEEVGAEGAQRLAYRPAGWLAAASVEDLRDALEQSEAVRARWGAEPQQAGA